MCSSVEADPCDRGDSCCLQVWDADAHCEMALHTLCGALFGLLHVETFPGMAKGVSVHDCMQCIAACHLPSHCNMFVYNSSSIYEGIWLLGMAYLCSMPQEQQLICHTEAHVCCVCHRLTQQRCKVALGLLHAKLTCRIAVKVCTADPCFDLHGETFKSELTSMCYSDMPLLYNAITRHFLSIAAPEAWDVPVWLLLCDCLHLTWRAKCAMQSQMRAICVNLCLAMPGSLPDQHCMTAQ